MISLNGAFKKTFKSIRKRKFLFLTIIILQILFIISFLSVTVFFQMMALSNAVGIIEPLKNENFNPATIESGSPFLENFASIMENYNEMWKNIRYSIYLPILIFLILNGLIWSLIYQFIEKFNLKKFFSRWRNFIISSIVVLIPYFILADIYISKIFVIEMELNTLFKSIALIAGVFVPIYFLLLNSYGHLDAKSLKKFTKLTLNSTIKEIGKTLPPFIIIHLFYLVGGYIIYLNFTNLIVIYVTIIVLLLVSVFFKMFWITYLNNETNHN